VDRADDDFVRRAREVPGVITLELTPFAGGVVVDIEIEPTDTSVTELLRAVSSNGVTVHEIRFEEPRPMEVFTEITQGSDIGE